jgi:hypothetical protein
MEIGKDINTERLICEVTIDEKNDIKSRARKAGVTVRQYIYESISLRIQLEDKNKIKFSSQGQ